MKKITNYLALSAALVLGLTFTAAAQVSFGLHGTIATPTFKGDNIEADTKIGGGAMLKFHLGPNVAIGAAAKYINTGYTRTGGTGINSGFEFIGSMIPVTGTLDFYLSQSAVRPYIGVEAGPYFNRVDFRLNGQDAGNTNQTQLGVAPKLGLTFALGGIGLFAEGQYHLIFGSANGNINTTAGNISYDNPTKILALNAGLIFGLPRADAKRKSAY